MDVPIQNSYTSSAGSIGRVASYEDVLMNKKLTDFVKIPTTPIESQDLFEETCIVPTEIDTADLEEDTIEEKQGPVEEDSDNVPAAADDINCFKDEEFIDIALVRSPVTPDAFDKDQMNLDTPNIEFGCTQAFFSMMNTKISPPKRKCALSADYDEPLNSTQTFFNMSKHYQYLSRERKKIMFPTLPEEHVHKPLRRKLFDKPDDFDNPKDVNYSECLENAEDLLLSIILPGKADKSQNVTNNASNLKTLEFSKTDMKGNDFETTPISLKTSKSECSLSEVGVNIYCTPLNKTLSEDKVTVSAKSVNISSAPDLVGDTSKTPQIPCDTSKIDSEIPDVNLENTTNIAGNQETDKYTTETIENFDNRAESEKLEQRDENKDINKIEDEKCDSKDNVDDLKESVNVMQLQLSELQPALNVDSRSNESEDISTVHRQTAGKRKLVSKAEFKTENRVYKVRRVEGTDRQTEEEEEEAEIVNCPEIVTKMFRLTNLPARGVPSYPPEISKVVPIPVQETPRKAKTGLSRRSLRTSLHPYLVHPGIIKHEE